MPAFLGCPIRARIVVVVRSRGLKDIQRLPFGLYAVEAAAFHNRIQVVGALRVNINNGHPTQCVRHALCEKAIEAIAVHLNVLIWHISVVVPAGTCYAGAFHGHGAEDG